MLILVVVLVAAGVVVGVVRIDRPLASPTLTASLPASLVVPGATGSLPWPSTGQGAVSVPALGFAAQSGAEPSVPIASLTKMTNALVVLEDHPVAPGASGPSIVITAGDVVEYDAETHEDQSTVPIQVGEVLTERQMLEAMLTQSANDIAYSLAVWDAGSTGAFVAKMNAKAATLGMTGTHFVDVSGYDPGSVSTASDCLRVAAAAMAVPTFAEVVSMSSVTLPLVGTVPNIVTEIGSNGVIGIKSGYTSEAKACMVLAAMRSIDGQNVLVLAAVLGQPVPAAIVPATTTTTTTAPPAPGATTTAPTAAPTTTTTTTPDDDLEVPDVFRYTGPVIMALLDAAVAAVTSVPVARAGQSMGEVTAVWGGEPHRVEVVAGRSASLVGWPGQTVATRTRVRPVPAGGRPGLRVGTVSFALGEQSEAVPLRLAAGVPQPSWWWRLVHH